MFASVLTLFINSISNNILTIFARFHQIKFDLTVQILADFTGKFRRVCVRVCFDIYIYIRT